MKYVMLNHCVPILFTNDIMHKVFKKIDNRTVTSAGFFSILNGKVNVFGKSESLNLQPEPGDEVFIAKLLGL